MKKLLLGFLALMVSISAWAGVPSYAYKDGHVTPVYIEIDTAIQGRAFEQISRDADSLKNCPECQVVLYGVGENSVPKVDMVKQWLLNNEKVPLSQVRELKTAGMEPFKTSMKGVISIIATKESLDQEYFAENIYVQNPDKTWKPFFTKGQDCRLKSKNNGTYYIVALLCPGFDCKTAECLEVVATTPPKQDCSTCKSCADCPANCSKCQGKNQTTYVGRTDKQIWRDGLLYWGPAAAIGTLAATQIKAGGADGPGGHGGDAGMCRNKQGDLDWGCVALATGGAYVGGTLLGYAVEKTIYVGKGKNKKEISFSPAPGGIKAKWK